MARSSRRKSKSGPGSARVAQARDAAMKSNFLTCILWLAAVAAFAGSPMPPVIKIVHRYIWPQMPAEAFAGKPKTLYIGGDKYARVEEEPDPERHIHGLTICNEPDIWMINLLGHHGQHLVDPGPTFATHHLILGREAVGELRGLEFGREVDFFQRHQAVRQPAVLIEGLSCEALAVTQGNYRIVLCLKPDTHLPFQLDVFKAGAPQFSIRYLTYDTDVPFTAALFKPPGDIVINETGASATPPVQP